MRRQNANSASPKRDDGRHLSTAAKEQQHHARSQERSSRRAGLREPGYYLNWQLTRRAKMCKAYAIAGSLFADPATTQRPAVARHQPASSVLASALALAKSS